MSAPSLLTSIIYRCCRLLFFFFFFNDTATTEIYTLSLHDALPISSPGPRRRPRNRGTVSRMKWRSLCPAAVSTGGAPGDRKSTRLNSSHSQISYAVFCLKKKKKTKQKRLSGHYEQYQESSDDDE